MTPGAGRRLWGLVALAALALVLRATLVPTSDPDADTVRWCVLCGDYGLADAIGNLVLFVPLALGLRGSGVSARTTVVAALLLSTAIELAQLFVPGRESALGDIVANTAGTALAVMAWRWWPVRRSGPGGIAGAAAMVALAAGLGWTLRPSYPRTVYYGQWTAELGQYDRYRGKVLSASIGGSALPSWRLDDPATVRLRLGSGDTVEVRGIAGPRTQRLAPLFSIADDRTRGILLIGLDRDDLVLLPSTSAPDLRLHQPEVRWRGALSGIRPGDSLVVAAHQARGGYCLGLNGNERCGLGFTVGRAWALVHPLPGLPAAALVALDCAFMILLGFPAGLLMRRGVPGAVAAAIGVAGVVVLPSLQGIAPTPLAQVGALGLGLVAAALTP
jgi:hypothetical protein